MRKGFSYPAYLVYSALLASLLLTTLPFFFSSIQKSFMLNQQLLRTKTIIHALDAISKDLEFAQTVSVEPDQVNYTKNNTNYSYSVSSKRLARKKEGITYLTPKEIIITDFKTETFQPKLLKISFCADEIYYERYIPRTSL